MDVHSGETNARDGETNACIAKTIECAEWANARAAWADAGFGEITTCRENTHAPRNTTNALTATPYVARDSDNTHDGPANAPAATSDGHAVRCSSHFSHWSTAL